MTVKKNARLLFAFSFVAILGCFLIESESQAQRFWRPPGQELGRFLGLGYGNGYHCRTPGPQSDYYNPYSYRNSHLVSRGQSGYHHMSHGYHGGGNGGTIPHSVYTGTSDGYSNFEGLPGQTMTPTFAPASKPKGRDKRDLEERNFEDELDLGDTGIGADDFEPAAVDREESGDDSQWEDEDQGDFENLRDSYESLREDLEDLEDLDINGSTTKSVYQPSEEDQAVFFGTSYGGN